ncbi:hypothetical protein BJ508DRAFT_315038 [Ascobolus immersus RN42]|uniref:Uncharacterized protein n=1 Tax=Ascobolus immersus RN42 TaxID=1160509 RepID=A0A3N4HCJ1_ASCIM|nr:hypothetical protein BJ508DRAFT_315038 [Ascobolus immersus RN42]
MSGPKQRNGKAKTRKRAADAERKKDAIKYKKYIEGVRKHKKMSLRAPLSSDQTVLHNSTSSRKATVAAQKEILTKVVRIIKKEDAKKKDHQALPAQHEQVAVRTDASHEGVLHSSTPVDVQKVNKQSVRKGERSYVAMSCNIDRARREPPVVKPRPIRTLLKSAPSLTKTSNRVGKPVNDSIPGIPTSAHLSAVNTTLAAAQTVVYTPRSDTRLASGTALQGSILENNNGYEHAQQLEVRDGLAAADQEGSPFAGNVTGCSTARDDTEDTSCTDTEEHPEPSTVAFRQTSSAIAHLSSSQNPSGHRPSTKSQSNACITARADSSETSSRSRSQTPLQSGHGNGSQSITPSVSRSSSSPSVSRSSSPSVSRSSSMSASNGSPRSNSDSDLDCEAYYLSKPRSLSPTLSEIAYVTKMRLISKLEHHRDIEKAIRASIVRGNGSFTYGTLSSIHEGLQHLKEHQKEMVKLIDEAIEQIDLLREEDTDDPFAGKRLKAVRSSADMSFASDVLPIRLGSSISGEATLRCDAHGIMRVMLVYPERPSVAVAWLTGLDERVILKHLEDADNRVHVHVTWKNTTSSYKDIGNNTISVHEGSASWVNLARTPSVLSSSSESGDIEMGNGGLDV